MWRGWATPANADLYEEHFTSSVEHHLQSVPGFVRAELLRRREQDLIELVALTVWDTLDAIRAFAGDAYEVAVVEPEARRVLQRFEETVVHYEVQRSVTV